MRKVLNYSLFFLLSFVFIISFAKADSCNYKEQAALNKEAKNIDYQYEFIKDDSINKYFKIYITNIPEDLRLEVTDDYSNQTKDIIYQETEDGLYTMNMYTSNKRTKYTINIYAISGSCSGSLLYKKTFTTPRYNPFSTSYICEEEPDYKYCNLAPLRKYTKRSQIISIVMNLLILKK